MKRIFFLSFVLLTSLSLWAQTQVGNTDSPIYYKNGNVMIGAFHADYQYDLFQIIKSDVAGFVTTYRNNSGSVVNRIYGVYNGETVEYQERIARGTNKTSIGNYTNHNFSIRTNNIDRMVVDRLGNVGIGTNTPNYKLDVLGTIRARELKVDMQGADFVFEEDYPLRPISELEDFVKANKHLPEIAPAKEMQENGVNQSEMNQKLLQKIEELSLYVIDLNKSNVALKKRVEELEQK